MQPGRIVSAAVKLWILAILAGAIYFLWRSRAAPPLAGQLEEADNISRTSVEVRIGTIRQMTLHSYVVGFGSVEPAPATADAPAADARLTVDWPATITAVSCTEGQQVAKGQPLFVENPAQLAGGAVQKAIASPIAGTVVLLDVHPGEVALPNKTAVEVVDVSRLVVAANVPAWEAGRLATGQSAAVEAPAAIGAPAAKKPSEIIPTEGSVQRIDRAVDPATNTVSVDISLPPDSHLRPGQFARVRISEQELNCLAVPADAIVRDSLDRPFVAVVSDDHKQATLKLVQPGLRDGDWVQVSGDGLAAGQTIVVSGAYALQYRNEIVVLNP